MTGLWLYANTARGLICRLRTFGADSKIAIRAIILGVRRVKIALNQRPLRPVRARPLLLRVKSSERLSFVKSRLRVPNWPPRTIVVRMESTHELEEAWASGESTINFRSRGTIKSLFKKRKKIFYVIFRKLFLSRNSLLKLHHQFTQKYTE